MTLLPAKNLGHWQLAATLPVSARGKLSSVTLGPGGAVGKWE